MYAYVIDRPEGSFNLVDTPRPVPGNDQVLVRVRATGINPLDAQIRAGRADHAQQPLPAVLGIDMAGTVEDVGANVAGFLPGDEVYGMVGGVGGLQGTLAEYVVTNADLLAHKPKSLSMREAATLPLATITAWSGLVDRAGVQAGHTVLVRAGAGGVGHIAVQLAQSFGAKVFATISAKREPIAGPLGATTIDDLSRSTAQYVDRQTAGQGFDIVLDTVGGNMIGASFRAARPRTGHVVSCCGAGTSSPVCSQSTTHFGVLTAIFSVVYPLTPLLTGIGQVRCGQILAVAARLVDTGSLYPVVTDETFSLSEIDDAFSLVTSGRVDKVVVDHTSKGSKDSVLKAGPIEPIPATKSVDSRLWPTAIRSVCSRM